MKKEKKETKWDKFKQEFKKGMVPHREWLWSTRGFWFAYGGIIMYTAIIEYAQQDINLWAFLFNVDLSLIIAFLPLGFGLKKEKNI